MASTGLLGINPYRGGNVAIDISSRPTQLSIGLMQKQQAKAEAVDKYFKDWEKSINPAGLSKAEVDLFAKKLKEVQEYGIKNKQAITNPSKYGYDAQSTLMAGFKDLQSFVEQGKQATAERKAFKDYVNQAIKSGKRVSDNYLDILNNAMLPVGAGYTPPDMTQINIYDPHDDLVFTDKTWKGINLPVTFDYEKEVVNGKTTGRVKPIEIESITPEVASTYAQRVLGYYRDNLGTQEQYNNLIKDKDFVNQLNPIYKKYFKTDIKNPADLAVAYGLSTKQPQRKEKGGFDFPKEYYFEEGQRRQDIRSALSRAAFNRGTSDDKGNLFDLIPDVAITGGGSIKNGQAFDKNGNPYNGKIKLPKEYLPSELFSVIGNPRGVKEFDITFENGTPVKFVNEKTGVITRQGMLNYQLKYNTEPAKGEQLKFPSPKPKPGSKKPKPY